MIIFTNVNLIMEYPMTSKTVFNNANPLYAILKDTSIKVVAIDTHVSSADVSIQTIKHKLISVGYTLLTDEGINRESIGHIEFTRPSDQARLFINYMHVVTDKEKNETADVVLRSGLIKI